MGIFSRVAQGAFDSAKDALKFGKEALVDPVARAALTFPATAISSIQKAVPGGSEGDESFNTPFGEVKPMANIFDKKSREKEGTLKPGEAAWGAAELATSIPGAAEKIGAKLLKPVASKVAKVVEPIAEKTGELLKGKAVENISKLLNPTTKQMKATTQKIAQDIIDRGIYGSFAGITKQAKKGLEASAQALDEFGELLGEAPVSKVTDVLNKAKDSFFVRSGDKVALPNASSETAVKYIDYLKGQLESVADDAGNVSLEALRSFRQAWDATVKKAGGFAGNLDDTTKAAIEKEGADVIRNLLADEIPDLAKINKEFSFFKNLSDVLDSTAQRKIGQKSLLKEVATTTGAVVGASGGPVTSALTATAGRILSEIASSGLVRTLKAQAQNKLANALMDGEHSLERIAQFLKNSAFATLKTKDIIDFLNKDAVLTKEEKEAQIDERARKLEEIFGSPELEEENSSRKSLDEIFGR